MTVCKNLSIIALFQLKKAAIGPNDYKEVASDNTLSDAFFMHRPMQRKYAAEAAHGPRGGQDISLFDFIGKHIKRGNGENAD